MDLVKLGPNDSKLENEFDWDERNSIHTELENSTLVENRPSHNEFFERAEQTTLSNIRCNLAVPVLKLSAVIIRGNTDGTNKHIKQNIHGPCLRQPNGAKNNFTMKKSK